LEVTAGGGALTADQTVQEIHMRFLQGDLDADRHAFAQFEGCDRIAGLGDDRFLSCDNGQIAGGCFDRFAVLGGPRPCRCSPAILVTRWHLHDAAVVEFFDQGRHNFFFVPGFQPGHRPFCRLLAHRDKAPCPQTPPALPCIRPAKDQADN
jgi:hypothetical protein